MDHTTVIYYNSWSLRLNCQIIQVNTLCWSPKGWLPSQRVMVKIHPAMLPALLLLTSECCWSFEFCFDQNRLTPQSWWNHLKMFDLSGRLANIWGFGVLKWGEAPNHPHVNDPGGSPMTYDPVAWVQLGAQLPVRLRIHIMGYISYIYIIHIP